MAKIKLRRDTSQNWNNIDPTLASGEPGYDTTNNKLKIGNGTNAWSELSYLTDESGGAELGLFKFSGSTIGTKNNPDTGGWGAYDLVLNPGGESAASIYIPSVGNQGEGYPIQISNRQDPTSAIQLFGRGGVQIATNTGADEKVFEFRDDGKLTVPSWIQLGTNAYIVGNGDFVGLYPNSTGGASTGLELDGVNDALLVANRDVIIRANAGSPWKNWTFGQNGNLTLPGDIHGSVAYGGGGVPSGRIVNIAPADNASDKKFSFRIDQFGEAFTRAYLEMPEAQNNKQVAVAFPHSNNSIGYIFTQGTNTNDDGLNNAFNIFYNSGDIKLTAMTPGAGTFNTWRLGVDGNLTLPAGGDIKDSNGDSVLGTGSSIANNSFEVSIDSFGNISYPGSVSQSHKDSTVCSPNTDTVVYTSTDQYKHAIKLFVMVEGTPDGGTVWETQACDIIGVRGYLNNTVYVTTYGVTYSSNTAFATFDGRWNATTSRMEIVCRPTSTTKTVVVSVHAIEITSND